MVIKDRLANLISGPDAAEAVGVSLSTFRRFVEAGCLMVEYEQNGIEFFAPEQVSALFGRPLLANKATLSIKPEAALAVNSRQVADLEQDPDSQRAMDSAEPIYDTSYRAFDLEDYDELSPNNYEQATTRRNYTTGQESENVNYRHDNRNLNTSYNQSSYNQSSYSETNSYGESNYSQSNSLQSLQNEDYSSREETTRQDMNPAESKQAENLLKVISFQDSLLTERERQIEDLKSQTSWLKARIEKLEGLIEQSQLLLLADTYSIRKLLSPQPLRQSYMQKLLAAFGIKTGQASLEYRPKLKVQSTRSVGAYSLESKANKDHNTGRASGVVLHLDKQQSA